MIEELLFFGAVFSIAAIMAFALCMLHPGMRADFLRDWKR